ncbi:MAG: hypothetical protein LBV65_02175 [Desulfovibrio sp.]|jgi:hypothetical protein|nr:hypothetical protein [Desulfovibrio sp.]
MPVSVIPVRSDQELTAFVDLPHAVHSAHPLWIPPLKQQERALLRPGSHPFWESARRELFLALRDDAPVGRIAAIVDEKYNNYAKEPCGAFGFFECLEDSEAAVSLFTATRAWLKNEGMAFMRGPLNPSTNYTCGLLVHGFELPPTVMMPWNPPYYASLLEGLRLRKEQDLLAWLIERDRLVLPDRPITEAARLKAEGRFTYRCSGKTTLARDIHTMLDIYRQSWAENWGFSPLSEAESAQLVKELKQILNPEYFILFFHNNEPAGGVVALPDMNPLLKRLRGSIGITAPWHWWRALPEIRRGCRTILFGVKDAYRLMGLPLLLFGILLEEMRKNPRFQWVEGSWVLEDNSAINTLLEDFSGRITKRYRIYRQELVR